MQLKAIKLFAIGMGVCFTSIVLANFVFYFRSIAETGKYDICIGNFFILKIISEILEFYQNTSLHP